MTKNRKIANLLGKEIRLTRRINEITLEKLAKQVGITKQGINKVEKGKSEPGVITFLKIWKALGKKMEELEKFIS